MGKVLLIIFSIFLSINARSEILINLGTNISSLSTKELRENKTVSNGTSQLLGISYLLDKRYAIGLEQSSKKHKVAIEHDGEDGEIHYNVQDFGLSGTVFLGNFYLHGSYGKSEVSEKLEIELTSANKNIVKDLYNIRDSVLSRTYAKVGLGYQLFSLRNFYFSIGYQVQKILDDSHSISEYGLELVINI